MPDFDKDLKPLIKDTSVKPLDVTLFAPTPERAMGAGGPNLSGEDDSIFAKLAKDSKSSDFSEKGVFVSDAELAANMRYGVYNPTVANKEDYAAYGQSVADKAANGLLKGLNLAGTTIAGSFGMLYGVVKSPFSGRLADIWDNEATRALDDWNTKVDQEYLPNFYTDAEKNAAWYSTDNWFKTNFLFDKLIKNSGFAVGAMVTGNIANTGLLKAGQLLGKAAAAGSTAAEASQAFKLFSPLLKNTARAFSNAKNIEAAAILEKEINSIADLATRTSKLGELAKTTNSIANFSNTARRTAIAAYSSAGEASFEALATANEFRDKLIEKYIEENGEAPSGDDLKIIDSKADNVGRASFFGNLALLGATEYVQLPKLLGSNYSASKQAANSLLGKTDDVLLKDGKYVAKEATTKFGKIYDKVTGVSRYVFDPKEGAQEGLQYALQVGVQNYYNKAYRSNNANLLVDGLLYGLVGEDKYGEGVGALNSKEGMESMFLGGITGAAMQIRGNIQETLSTGRNTNAFLGQLNSTPGFKQSFIDRMNSVNRANILQQQQQDAVIQGDKQEAKDIDADLMHNYLATRVKYGRYDMIKDDINDLRVEASTEQGLSSLKEQGIANINDTIQSFNERLSTFEKVAEYTNDFYKSLDLRYSGEMNKDGTKKYPSEVIDKMVYASAKIANYDLRIPQVNNTLVEAGINTSEILESIIKDLKPNKEATDTAIEQINELDVTSEIKDELKTNLSDVIEMSLRRKLFMQEYDDIKDNPSDYTVEPEYEFGLSAQTPVTITQEEKVKGKRKPVVTEMKLEVGKEYSLKQPFIRSNNKLISAPTITVLSQTLGGEYEVKLPDGTVTFMTPDEFKEYKVSEDPESSSITKILNAAIAATLRKKKFAGITVPEGEDALDYVNSLGNSELIDEIEKQFDKQSKEYLKQVAEEEEALAEANIEEELNETSDDESVQNAIPVEETTEEEGEPQLKEYEPDSKKTDEEVVDSTTAPVKNFSQKEPLAAHHVRANKFGANFYSLPNRDNLRGVIVTSKNEKLVLPGLTQWLKDQGKKGADVEPGETIAMVIVEVDPKTGKKRLVGVDGKPLTKGVNPLEAAIYQVFPKELTWSDGDSMFRDAKASKERKEVVAARTASYNKWRAATLDNPTLDLYQFKASFGIPEYVGNLTDTGKFVRDKSAAVGVEDSGLINSARLRTKRVINIPTTDGAVVNGSVTYNGVKGVPLLYTVNGIVPLNNRKISEKEASLIYDAIFTLANNLVRDGNMQANDSKLIFNWLKSVCYWGTPQDQQGNRKPAGYNSIFWERANKKIELIMSKDEKIRYSFKPADLKLNRDAIIADIQKLWNNANSTLITGGKTGDWNRSYVEIVSISGEKIQTRTWNNYQTFLLSNKNPDGSPRDAKTIPLTTQIRPLVDANDVNRQGIYFTVVNKVQAAEAPATKKAEVAPVAPTAPAAPKFNLTGAENTTDVAKAGDVSFTVTNLDEFKESNGTKGFKVSIPEITLEAMVTKLMTLGKITEDTSKEEADEIAKGIIDGIVKGKIEAQLKAEAPVAETSTAATVTQTDLATGEVVGTVTTSTESVDIEAKKAEADKLTPIEQNFADGQGGRKMQSKFAGKSTMDLILSGDRTRTTRANTDIQRMLKDYGLTKIEDLVGKIIRMTDKKGRTVYTEITKVAPFTKEYQDATWQKEGWEKEVTDKLVGQYPYAIEFKLAALEGGKPAAKSLQERLEEKRKNGGTKRSSEFRVALKDQESKTVGENWSQVEKWLKANFPNLPVYRVKNMIKATNGRQAWGMLKDGAIYLSESAETGTVYHEVFEAVKKMMLTPEEASAINAEFRGRTGSFVDRATGKTIKYSEATDFEIKEELAEEFRDFVQKKLQPTKGMSLIKKFFVDLAEFIKSFFVGPKALSNTEELFKRIGNGYYKDFIPAESALAFATKGFIDIEDASGDEDTEYSLVGFSGEQIEDIMQHMTYTAVKNMFENNDSLFNITSTITKKEFYDNLEYEMGDLLADKVYALEQAGMDASKYEVLYQNILDNWDNLVATHQDYIKPYNIEFSEDDTLVSTDENNNGKGSNEYADGNKIDIMKKTSGAIKLLLASLPQVDASGTERKSSIGGYKLIPYSEVFMGVMNNVHTSRNVTEMIEKVKEMSENDAKYRKLYSRLTKNQDIADLSNMHDIQLISAFWTSFKKQAPDVKNVYILDNGDIVVGDSNFTSAARQSENEFVNAIKLSLQKGSKYFIKAKDGKSFIGNTGEAVNIDLTSVSKMVDFLGELGIIFDKAKLEAVDGRDRAKFAEAVKGIRASIAEGQKIASVTGKTLNISKRLRELSEVKAKSENPEFSSTYYNVKGERTQTFIGTNAASDLFDALSQIDNLNELRNTQYDYLLDDTFAKNSVILYKMFDKQSGERIEGFENLMKTAYADGTVDAQTGKQKQSSKLSYKERLLQELNLNLSGYYMNLVPGDASMEWMTYTGNAITTNDILDNFDAIHNIFRGYFVDEFNLAKSTNRPVAEGREPNELRFFKDILGDKLNNDVLSYDTAAEALEAYGGEINDAVTAFITGEAEKVKKSLETFGAVKRVQKNWVTEGLSFSDTVLTDSELTNEMNTLAANFAINNIEMHKLIYSDPYQYKDELKRIKNFNSPRQAIMYGSTEINSAMNIAYNKGIEEGDIAYTDFNKDYFKSIVLNDVFSSSDLEGYGTFEETDGGGMITLKAHRNFKIRANQWDDQQEAQYRYDMAWEKRAKKGKLSEAEVAILEKGNPKIKRMYTPVKPIVSGNKANGNKFNDVILDKFALYPLSYRVLSEINPKSNAIKLYDKMQAEDIDYAVYATGRKVGNTSAFDLYDETGAFNSTPSYETGVTNVPFAIMSVQSDVPSKDIALVTRGSQMTKLVTLDFMEAGVPVDFMKDEKDINVRLKAWENTEDKEEASKLYKEIRNNQLLLEELLEVGVESLLKRFDIKVVNGDYVIGDINKVANTLQEALSEREMNINISEALKGYRSGDTVIEATSAYKQIRNILYSIADSEVISPKISGGQKVQIPSTLLEENRIKAKGKGYTSDVLKFYTNKNGERVCQVMVARWFKSSKSDAQLIKELNKSGILNGVGFRIPTQKQNSIDVFEIAGFLPEEFGDSIVIPSALVKKAGSDFDIDKLSVYLKNVIVNEKTGEVKLMPYKGIGKAARDTFNNVDDYKKSLENAYIESLEKLISSEENFANLVKPNSAEDLKKLSGEIVDMLGENQFNFKAVGNMLSRDFMSKLRQAFVSGKYALGIAAVNQTSHSLNQRQPIYLDLDKIGTFDKDERAWYSSNTNINFQEYNKIMIDGKEVPSLSGIKDAKGNYISDTIGMFIDGYVDIAKGPWIIQMGATPNTASTWLFLVKMGVPIDTVAYFMNQPIIRDYLQAVENEGYSWLFIDDIAADMLRKYNGDGTKFATLPSEEDLKKSVGKKEFTPTENAMQQFILREFFKYAKMGEQSFILTQGVNFDTANFNDPFLVFKKAEQLEKARGTIISSADGLLNNSFLGKLRLAIINARNAISKLLKADQGAVREVLQDVLRPYVGMNDRDFVKTSQRAVAALFDFSIQTEGLNREIESVLLGNENVARQMTEFIDTINDTHPLAGNHVIKLLRADFADNNKKNVNNLYLKNKDNKLYDQNQLIYAFKELKEYLKGQDKAELYDRLVNLAVLQSGLNESRISFTSVLPYEDIRRIYNDILFGLEGNTKLTVFRDINAFERNYWNFDDIVPHKKAKGKMNYFTNQYEYNNNMKFGPGIDDAIKEGMLPKMVKISNLSKEAKSNVIVYSWEEIPTGMSKSEMIKAGDYSFIKKGLFKKVVLKDGKNFTIPGYKGGFNYVYQAINAWGDGVNANEFYDTPQKSKISNGFIEVDESIRVENFNDRFFNKPKEEPKEAPTETVNTELTIEEPDISDSASETASILTKLGAKKVSKGILLIDGQHWFLDRDKWEILTKVGRKELYLYPDGKDGKDGLEMFIGSSSSVNDNNIISEGSAFDQMIYSFDDKEGEIIDILNAKFRLLDVKDIENVDVGDYVYGTGRLLTVTSKSGLTSYFSVVFDNDSADFIFNLLSEKQAQQYINQDNFWKEEDNNDTCNPF